MLRRILFLVVPMHTVHKFVHAHTAGSDAFIIYAARDVIMRYAHELKAHNFLRKMFSSMCPRNQNNRRNIQLHIFKSLLLR